MVGGFSHSVPLGSVGLGAEPHGTGCLSLQFTSTKYTFTHCIRRAHHPCDYLYGLLRHPSRQVRWMQELIVGTIDYNDNISRRPPAPSEQLTRIQVIWFTASAL